MRGYYLIILAAAIASVTLMLMATYKEYQGAAQGLMTFVGLVSSLITIYEFFLRKK